MGLSHKWVWVLFLLISVVCHMIVITHGDEIIEAGKWTCDECKYNPRMCARGRCPRLKRGPGGGSRQGRRRGPGGGGGKSRAGEGGGGTRKGSGGR